MKIARVAIDVPLHTYFDYSAEHLCANDIGRRALVPFGRRLVVGVIVAIADPSDSKYQIKPIKEILHDAPRLPNEILTLANFCSAYYHYPLGQVLAMILPQRLRRTKATRALAEPCYALTEIGRALSLDDLPQRAAVKRKLLAALQTHLAIPRSTLLQLSPSAGNALRAMQESGWLQ